MKKVTYFGVLFGLLMLAPDWVFAANIIVDADGICTLAEAIDSANNNNADGNGCVDGSGDDIIYLETDVILEDGHINRPPILSEITIEGNGHIIDGGADEDQTGYVLKISTESPSCSGGDLTLNNATITGGNHPYYNENMPGNGGGIVNACNGELTLNNVTVTENTAAGNGGGIFNSPNGKLTLNNVTISGNTAEGDGGGISFSFNDDPSGPGNSTSATLNNVTISGNSADEGGGIFNSKHSKLNLNNVTVSGNIAESTGGGIYYEACNNVSTFFCADHYVTLKSSIVSGNTALINQGNEIYRQYDGSSDLDGNINADSSNLFGHSGEDHDDAFYNFSPSPNDINATTNAIDCDTEKDNCKPTPLSSILVSGLADNGTHALVPGSPAIDLDTSCGTEDNPDPDRPWYQQEDQRGEPRPVGNGCDAGSFEFSNILGDIDGDGDVDSDDLALLSGAFGSVQGDPTYNTGADLDADGDVDGQDLSFFAKNFVPVIAEIQPQTVTEGELLSLNITASDPDNGTLHYPTENLNLPQGASLADNGDGTAVLSWTPTCSQTGDYSSVIEVRDQGNLSDSETLAISVFEDNIAPTVLTKDITVQLDASGHASITPADIDNGSHDACGVTLSIDKSEFTGADIGENTVTLTATDSNGNSGMETSTVTVEGNSTSSITVDSNGNCTLHDAITAANTDTGSGGCPASSGEDTIYLETDVTLDTPLPELVTSIIIKGQDHTIDGNNDPAVGSVLRIGTDGNLTLYNTTVMGGKSFWGGGINNEGELALINSIVKNNSVSCLDSETDAVGGGIYNKGSLTLSNSLVNDNSASCSEPGRYALGGGIVNGGEEATASLSNSTITSNSVSCSEQGGYALGGGIVNGWSVGGTLIMDASTVNGNSVSCSNGYAAAGGIANVEGGDLPVTLTLTNSTVSGNVTLPESSIYRSGGGIANWGAEVIMSNSTITDNLTSGNGGGIENIGGAALTLKSSIVSGNTATASGHANEIYNDSSSTVTANSYNLFGHSGITDVQAIAGFTPGFNDTTATCDGTNPTALSAILSPLADNGGPTKTHALVAGNPAIDLDATCSTGLTEDQRGEPRPVGEGCDAGSFEISCTSNIIVDAGGICTLVEAINSANNDDADGNGCADGCGADTIILETDVTLEAALPQISSIITIEGNGHFISGNKDESIGSVLYVTSAGNLTLNETTVKDGKLSFSTPFGGGIFNGGTVTLNRSTVSGNSTEQYGGGIYNVGGITLSHSAIRDNWANFGGGIFNNSNGTVTLIDSTVSSNNTGGMPGVGGGVYNKGNQITITNSTVSGNSADMRGGGIYNGGGVMFLTNSTVTGNSTSGSLGEGGGIYNSTALTLTNSTVSENSVEGIGGGIYNNSWNKATLFSSIISGNQASDGGNEVYNYQSSNIVADSYNLFGHSGENNAEAFYGFIPGSSDVNATNGGIDGILIPTAQSAILHPLGDNGGPTMTHTLVPGSPALDLDASCSALQEAGKELLDQRGESRPVGNGCDAGSFELSISPQDTRAFLPAIYSLLL